jgi:hypothetical protein
MPMEFHNFNNLCCSAFSIVLLIEYIMSMNDFCNPCFFPLGKSLCSQQFCFIKIKNKYNKNVLWLFWGINSNISLLLCHMSVWPIFLQCHMSVWPIFWQCHMPVWPVFLQCHMSVWPIFLQCHMPVWPVFLHCNTSIWPVLCTLSYNWYYM